MAHFAQVVDGVVVNVVVVPDDEEHRGQEFLAEELGLGGVWVQTSYNARIRNKYAGIGDLYLPDEDVFVGTCIYPSWTLDEHYEWQPPIPRPSTSATWDEQRQLWLEDAS